MLAGRNGRECSELLKALADRTRMDVLLQLLAGPRSVEELLRSLGIEQSLLSHHLQVLRRMGLVSSERSGRNVLYRLEPGVASADGDALDLGCCVLRFEDATTPLPTHRPAHGAEEKP